MENEIDAMIDSIIAGENTQAKEVYDSIIGQKVTASLDQKKIELAQQIYNNTLSDKENITSSEDNIEIETQEEQPYDEQPQEA